MGALEASETSNSNRLLSVLSETSHKMTNNTLSNIARSLSLRSKSRSASRGAQPGSRADASAESRAQPRSKSSEGTTGERDGKKSASPSRVDGLARTSQEKKEEKDADRKERRRREQDKVDELRRSEDQKARGNVDEETRARYGDEPPSVLRELSTIAEAAEMDVGAEVTFRARIHHQRDVSKTLDFLLLRDQTHSIQGVLSGPPEMVKWAQRLNTESIVQVTGTLQKPPGAPVRSASHQDREVLILSIHLVAPARGVPFTNYDPPDAMHPRISSRVVDLRHPANQALFRVRAAMTHAFRESLDAQGFIEIQTPKLQPAATESGAEVFKVNYFGRSAFLAQSPQLAKQMAIAADFKRVYEIGPVFRAENSNTHRHLTEYTGMDIEMAIDVSYHEVLRVIDTAFKAIFTAVRDMPELKVIRERWPSVDLVWLDETPVISFRDAMQMLREAANDGSGSGSDSSGSGITSGCDESGPEQGEDDFSTRDEIRLGKLVKKKYGTDYFIVDRYPASVRPFYTHRDDSDPALTNSFDIFLRGQEIGTGGQRIHDADELRHSMVDAGVAEDGLEDYLDAFEFGAPPHGGTGLGLDRIVTFLLELGDVRLSSPFHRDTKSLPARPPALPHPEASTKPSASATRTARSLSRLTPPESPSSSSTTSPAENGSPHYPPLEKLIANYGDAANTSWLDARFELWRHPPTGAAVGYVRQGDKLAIVAGDPLCDASQFSEVLASFVRFAEQELKRVPVFLIVSDEVQAVLAQEHGWRTLTCIEEQRVADTEHNSHVPSPVDGGHGHGHGHSAERNARKVQREGIRVREFRPERDPGVVARADKAIIEWREHRKGKRQMHMTEIRPWVDQAHRRYFVAERGGSSSSSRSGSGSGSNNEGGDGEKGGGDEKQVLGLVVLARLAPRHGWQVKWALDMPGSPGGTIEVLVAKALGAVAGSPVTFGTGVSKTLTPRAHIGSGRARVLAKTYDAFARSLGLGRKAEFREKFGVVGEATFICYPKHGLGVGDFMDIVRFFED